MELAKLTSRCQLTLPAKSGKSSASRKGTRLSSMNMTGEWSLITPKS